MPIPHSILIELDALLVRTSADPANLALHERLLEAALRYKVCGGPPLGFRAQLSQAHGARCRLHRAQKAWAMDVLSVTKGVALLEALARVTEEEGTNVNDVSKALSDWIQRPSAAADRGGG
jgi:hypothetical protein